jgi:hypothetical protein
VEISFLVTDETAGKRKKGSDAFESGTRECQCFSPGRCRPITSAACRHVNRGLVQVPGGRRGAGKGRDLIKDFQFGFQSIDFSGFYFMGNSQKQL